MMRVLSLQEIPGDFEDDLEFESQASTSSNSCSTCSYFAC